MKYLSFQDISQIKLSKLSCDDLIQLLGKINELRATMESLSVNLKENAITGKVLMYCDLNELKVVSLYSLLNVSKMCKIMNSTSQIDCSIQYEMHNH
jgi:hypothetical protein